MKSSSIKYFLYARKSTDERERQVMSLDSQMTELRMLANRERASIHETIEESRTAKEPGRPLFNDMLDRIDQGEANGILIWDIDRLYRNPLDEGRVRWMLRRGIIASIRTPSRQFLPDDAGLLMGVEGGRATDYIIHLARNITRGVREKLRRGEWPGGTKPPGYLYDHRLRNIVPDPNKSKVILAFFEEVSKGRLGLEAGARWLAERGIMSKRKTPFAKAEMHRLLTNRLYSGVMMWKGEAHEGKFTPLVPVDLFQKVQSVLKRKSKPRRVRKGHNFPFCGIFGCPCGSMITAQWARGKCGGLYRYYRCTRKNGPCDQLYLREEHLTKMRGRPRA